jgi:hypothetical protein
MKRIITLFFTTCIFLFPVAFIPSSAEAQDSSVLATDTTWGTIAANDGFDQKFTIYKDGDNLGVSDFGDDITYTIEVQCSKKKLSVLVYSDPIGIYPSTSFGSIDGYALTKIDSGKIIKYSYISLRDSSGIQLNTPKSLTSAILKGKGTFSFKIPSSIKNDTVATFSIGDFPSYAAKFKSLGCPLK